MCSTCDLLQNAGHLTGQTLHTYVARSVTTTRARTHYAGVLHLPSATGVEGAVGRAPFFLGQLEAELDYLCIPTSERTMSAHMRMQRTSVLFEQALVSGHEGLEELAEYLLTRGVRAMLSRGTTVGYFNRGVKCSESIDGAFEPTVEVFKSPYCRWEGHKSRVDDDGVSPAVVDALRGVLGQLEPVGRPAESEGSEPVGAWALQHVVDTMCRPLREALGGVDGPVVSVAVVPCAEPNDDEHEDGTQHPFLCVRIDQKVAERVYSKACGFADKK